MPRKSIAQPLLVLLVVCPLLLAMGGGGGAPVTDQIPRPQDNHAAILTDRRGVTTEVDHLSCNGKTFFPLQRGAGTLMVPFGKINGVALGADNGDAVPATVSTAAGQSLEGSLARDLVLTGVTEFGNYRVELVGLQEIRFP